MNNYDEIKNIYDNNFIYNNEFANYEDDFSFWIHWIKKIKPAKVLEIGIGNGRLIKLLSNTVSQYDGLDISQNINLLCNKVLMESFENLIIVFTNINRHILSTNISCF